MRKVLKDGMFGVKALAVKILLIMTGINLSNKAELGIIFYYISLFD